jgi:hypothetical protein
MVERETMIERRYKILKKIIVGYTERSGVDFTGTSRSA